MSETDTAASLVESIQGQSSLLLSLAIAMLGGAGALGVQLKVREGEILPLDLNYSLVIGILLLAASCFSAWLVHGALIDKIPLLMKIDFGEKTFMQITKEMKWTALIFLVNAQFLTFVAGSLLTVYGFLILERGQSP